jgi:hypothetical protein
LSGSVASTSTPVTVVFSFIDTEAAAPPPFDVMLGAAFGVISITKSWNAWVPLASEARTVTVKKLLAGTLLSKTIGVTPLTVMAPVAGSMVKRSPPFAGLPSESMSA